MLVTLGSYPKRMPAGFFKAVEFPVLAMLDTQTGDHRLLKSDGAKSRDLPLSIKYASKTSAMGGHDTAEVSGALFEVTIDPESGKMSGRGFLLNDEHGRRHARLIHTGAMRGNSVDLAEVKARFVEDMESEEYWIEFYDFKLAATTGVSTPAFAQAHAVVDDMTDEELTASFMASPMEPIVAQVPEELHVVVLGEPEGWELVASAGLIAPFDAFHIPESDVAQKIVIDPDGRVYGHLALWGSCHDGFADKCMLVPQPTDNYASFNKSGPLTERGQVETGPIFAFGGHRSAKSAKTIEAAYGGIENAWCDVRITVGRLGPWVSGVVRPGVSEETIYAARASRISGHWVNGKLKAIVSVNAEGYEVPGSGEFNVDFLTGFSYVTNDEGVAELVASFPGCADAPNEDFTLSYTFQSEADMQNFVEGLKAVEAVEAVANLETDANQLQMWADTTLADLLADDRDATDL